MGLRIFSSLLLGTFLLMQMACQPDTGDTHNDNGQHTHENPTHEEPTQQPPSTLLGITEDYENTNRVIWQKPEVVINLLGDITNQTIADIGAGTGFFALRLAPKAEKVIAIDIDERFINHIDSVKLLELPEASQDRLETRLATPNDPKLASNEADVIMIVNTFIYIRDKEAYLQTLYDAISEGGRLLIIDFKKKRTPLGPPSAIRLPLFEVENMLIEAGYKNVTTNDTVLDYQYVVTATK